MTGSINLQLYSYFIICHSLFNFYYHFLSCLIKLSLPSHFSCFSLRYDACIREYLLTYHEIPTKITSRLREKPTPFIIYWKMIMRGKTFVIEKVLIHLEENNMTCQSSQRSISFNKLKVYDGNGFVKILKIVIWSFNPKTKLVFLDKQTVF